MHQLSFFGSTCYDVTVLESVRAGDRWLVAS
jgi:hypothetical protein